MPQDGTAGWLPEQVVVVFPEYKNRKIIELNLLFINFFID